MTASPLIPLPPSDAPLQPDWPDVARCSVLSEHSMDALAQRLSGLLRLGDTLLLSGSVGAGKTHLARALIRAWLGSPEEPVPSPTFTLVQTYGTDTEEIWHVDLYRLGDPGEIAELGIEDAFGRALCLIEWPDRMAPDWPEGSVMLHLERLSDDARAVTLLAREGSDTAARLAPALRQ